MGIVRWLPVVLALAVVSCIEANLVPCADGQLCPAGTVCAPAPHGCVTPEQAAACASAVDPEPCAADPEPCQTSTITAGVCFRGVCVPAGCGNGVCEPSLAERCDDGNTISDDGCSADCRSREVCGDGFWDRSLFEECDDGNAHGRDGCTTRCTREVLHWWRLGAPAARGHAAMAHDPIREVTIAFGGFDAPSLGAAALDDTWMWNGTWIDVSPAESPAARGRPALAFDARRRRIVMFGGMNGELSLFNDTWEWTGATWERRFPATSPPRRAVHAMAFDGQRVVLFGGTQLFSLLGDTWVWDGEDWAPITTVPTPSPRDQHAMVFDAHRGRVVLYGGSDYQSGWLDDTWVFDGTSWTQLAAGQPQVAHPALAYDAARGVVILYGLVGGGSVVWELADSIWTQIPTAAPAPWLTEVAMTYDHARARVLVFGGFDSELSEGEPTDELWQWDGAAWQELSDEGPSSRCGSAMANDPVRGEVVLFGGRAGSFMACSGSALGDHWVWRGRGWVPVVPDTTGSRPSSRHDAAMVFDETSQRMLLFGGIFGFVRGDTWLWDGATWSQHGGAGPPARGGAAIAYDPVRGRVVLFGGRSDLEVLGDTWEWTGTAWEARTPPSAPAPREHAALSYDPARDRIVLFGGRTADGTDRDDMWEWDGTAWSELAVAVRPEPRHGHRLVYERARRRTLLLGGTSANATVAFEAWEWDGTRWTTAEALGAPGALYRPGAAYDTARRETVLFGGAALLGAIRDTWAGAYRGSVDEVCDAGIDLDGDGAIGCADADCAARCEPLCWPQTSCAEGPRCGDGVCSVLETPRSCPADCGAPAAECGDARCDPGETCAADC
jgi:cysteine-rich repeat protein